MQNISTDLIVAELSEVARRHGVADVLDEMAAGAEQNVNKRYRREMMEAVAEAYASLHPDAEEMTAEDKGKAEYAFLLCLLRSTVISLSGAEDSLRNGDYCPEFSAEVLSALEQRGDDSLGTPSLN